MTLKTLTQNWLPPAALPLVKRLTGRSEAQLQQRYLQGDRQPWSRGYGAYKQDLIRRTLQDSDLMAHFQQEIPLPEGYGIGVDERCVEYPWLFVHLPTTAKTVLDAGSVLNFDYLLDHHYFTDRQLHIVTLAPEEQCFWEKGISYLFTDLRYLPLREAYYDVIVCLSTLEHVGLDNRQYTQSQHHTEVSSGDYKLAIQELRRVLKPGGILLMSVPFGRYQNFGNFQQFDSALLAEAISAFGPAQTIDKTFFRYNAQGWQIATEAECAQCEYVHPDEWTNTASGKPNPIDKAAAAQAVTCIQIRR
jgi:SAM-dependent methyltransferase